LTQPGLFFSPFPQPEPFKPGFARLGIGDEVGLDPITGLEWCQFGGIPDQKGHRHSTHQSINCFMRDLDPIDIGVEANDPATEQ
jgi:hypothetical protein